MSPDTKLLRYDFVLTTEDEARQAREAEARKVAEAARPGDRLKVVDGLLVPDYALEVD